MANDGPVLKGEFPKSGSFRATSKEVERANRRGRGETQTKEGRNTKRFPETDPRTRHLTLNCIDRLDEKQKKNRRESHNFSAVRRLLSCMARPILTEQRPGAIENPYWPAPSCASSTV